MDRMKQIADQQQKQEAAMSTRRSTHMSRRRRSRAGFTLLEIMVALAVFSLMLTIILVPINLSLDMLHIGRARSEVQQASQVTINQIERELRQAVYVFPNGHVVGITDKYPYRISSTNEAPYYIVPDALLPSTSTQPPAIDQTFITAASTGSCDNTLVRDGNLARIDFLLPRRVNGVVENPVSPEYYLVTYYARRLKITGNRNGDDNYDPFRNPVVLFRAQIPYKRDKTNSYEAPDLPGALNLNLGASRYPLTNSPTLCDSANSRNTNRGAMWLVQSQSGEPNLEPLALTPNGTEPVGSHTLVTPRGMALILSNDLKPSTSFVCEDTNSDGKIDRVQISLELGEYDSGSADVRNGSPVDQRVRFPKVVDLPNVK